jgi:hypothetical protein
MIVCVHLLYKKMDKLVLLHFFHVVQAGDQLGGLAS